MCPSGGGRLILEKWSATWDIPTAHFDPDAARAEALARHREAPTPLAEMLVLGRPCKSARLKERLYSAGLKQRQCELCGQGEDWRGRRLALILDHVNGVHDDNRLENLRIVCPNCNATLDTHCGRNARLGERSCEQCATTFRARHPRQRFCSRACSNRGGARAGPRPETRRVERPPLEQLLAEIAADGWEATGRRHGVSGNAIRKWVRQYRAEAGEA
jgi:hypothetical protein